MRLHDALTLSDEGRFAEALRLLDSGSTNTAERLQADVLRIDLLERVGEYSRARYLAEKTLRLRSLPLQFQSDCRFVLGRIELEDGHLDTSVEQLTRAIELANQAEDAKRECWIRLFMMLVQCAMTSAQGAAPWISLCRLGVTKLGDPLISAALHVAVGEVAGKYGAVQTARRHANLALKLLDLAPNVWLTAWAQNTLVALALIEGDFETGMKHSVAASAAAELSGSAFMKRACLGNLGNLSMLRGSWQTARQYYETAAAGLRTDGEHRKGLLESIGRLHIFEERTDAARECLDAIDALQSPAVSTVYTSRHAQLTRAVALQFEGKYEEAMAQTAVALDLAERSGDSPLRNRCELTRAELLCEQGRFQELIALVDSMKPVVGKLPVEQLGHYECMLGTAVARTGAASGIAHFARAARVFDGMRHRPGQIQLERSTRSLGIHLPLARRTASPEPAQAAHAARAVQDVLALLLHVGRPELLATDAVEVLAATGCISHASAVAKHEDGRVEPLASHTLDRPPESPAPLPSRTLELGAYRDRSIQLTFTPVPSVDGVATTNAIATLLEIVRDLDSARAEREERLGLWPIEELPEGDDDAIVMGAMRELMRLARKVAPTPATVLITGESGTGKEIVARALHRYSNRASRPFVPFNCTAVPRELLESHLFGHRRGAFTGAERDHPGVVRTAKDGTLFLDEVGEMSAELQPKLLRFLESNEITPLGESEPVHVATRVVAATNANLDAMVQEGRFRADLFYRLRVIPLNIPPLRERRDEIPYLARSFVAKAAKEYGKGDLILDDESIELLVLYNWPGNVRQLNNELRRIVALADNDARLTADLLSLEIRRGRQTVAMTPNAEGAANETLMAALSRVEREMIVSALKTYQGRLDEAAKALGISRKGLYLKRLRFGL